MQVLFVGPIYWSARRRISGGEVKFCSQPASWLIGYLRLILCARSKHRRQQFRSADRVFPDRRVWDRFSYRSNWQSPDSIRFLPDPIEPSKKKATALIRACLRTEEVCPRVIAHARWRSHPYQSRQVQKGKYEALLAGLVTWCYLQWENQGGRINQFWFLLFRWAQCWYVKRKRKGKDPIAWYVRLFLRAIKGKTNLVQISLVFKWTLILGSFQW
jgi:hypothetical protein